MKRSLLTTIIFLAGISLAQGQGTPNVLVGTDNLLVWNDGPDRPNIWMQGVDKIVRCSNGTLQTGHTESKAIDDYRWVWDECPKVKVLDFNNMISGMYVCDKDTCKETSGTLSIPSMDHQVIVDGDIVTITGKIKVESPK